MGDRTNRVIDKAVVLGVVAYVVFLAAHTPRAVGGSDSSGYMNLATGLARGTPVVPVPGLEELGLGPEWQRYFMPLAFVPGPDPGTMAPMYPPGYPLLLAAFATLFGWTAGPFLVPAFFAGLGVGLLYLLGRLLGLGAPIAAAGAAVLAAWPVYVFTGIQLMSDTVATAWCLGAVVLAVASTRVHRGADWAAAGCGAVFVFSVLIRPTNVLLAPALATMLLPSPRRIILFLLGGLPVGIPWLAYNHYLYGHALATGYASLLTNQLALANFAPRFAHYGRWLATTLPLPLAAWLILPVNRWISVRTRLLIGLWGGAYILFYCFYGPYETWWYLRFLAPGVPAIILGGGLTLQSWQQRHTKSWQQAVAVVAAVVTLGVAVEQGRRLGVLRSVEPQMSFVRGTDWIASLPQPVMLASMQFSGAVFHYSEAIPVRWDHFNPSAFDYLRRRTELRGYRWYALLWRGEAPMLSERMPGRWQQIQGLPHASLWRLPPRPAEKNAGLNRHNLKEVLEYIAQLPDPAPRARLAAQARRAFRFLRQEEYSSAVRLLRVLDRRLSALAVEGGEISPAVEWIRLWRLLPPGEPPEPDR